MRPVPSIDWAMDKNRDRSKVNTHKHTEGRNGLLKFKGKKGGLQKVVMLLFVFFVGGREGGERGL